MSIEAILSMPPAGAPLPVLAGAYVPDSPEPTVPPVQFSIDPGFKSLIPALTLDELNQLETNLLRDGCLEPLSLWDSGNGYALIDGHNRYSICQKHQIPFDTTIVWNLSDRAAVELWIEEKQLGRRNLTDDQRACLADSIRERRAKVARRTQLEGARAAKVSVQDSVGDTSASTEKSHKNSKVKERTRVAVAKEARVPERKLRAVQEVKKANPGLIDQVRTGTITLAEAKRQVRRAEVNQSLNSIEAIQAKELAGIYDVAVIDPPWPLVKIERDERPNQVNFDYPVMTVEQIAEEVSSNLLPHLAEHAHIFLWSTQKFLPDALELLKRWGLKYICTFVWHKSGGFQPIGLPQYNCEFVVYARKGSPKFIDTKQFFTCFEAPRGKHSEKPEAFYETLRRVTGGRRLDLFNRRKIDGFEGWGKEAVA